MTTDNAAPAIAPEVPLAGTPIALKLAGVTKTFPGVTALDNVYFDCREGEIHALVGENGSGKSTLLKVAAGVYVPDRGTVEIGGTALGVGKPSESRKLGLMTAYQDTSLIGEFTVAQNLELSFHSLGEKAPRDIKALLKQYELSFGPGDLVKSLGPGGRQMLEVVRAISHSPKVLVLDEPTAALDMATANQLQDIVKKARDEGMAIVYVSHRLEEVRRLADRLTVLRDGVIRGTHDRMDWNVEEIVELMVGTKVGLEFPDRAAVATAERPLLEVQDLVGPKTGPVSLKVSPGEIVGIAGAEGSGQREVLRGIIGVARRGGEVSLDGRPLNRANPKAALAAGISYQSGDRAAESTFGAMSVLDNATIQLDTELGPAGLSLPGPRLSKLRAAIARLGIVTASPYQPIGGLSGGNQQKVVLSRPALRRPKLLLIDEPTQGVDARARLDIYGVIADAAADGVGVLINSSDSAELAGMCDRVYVMSDGLIIDEIEGDFSESDIVRRFVSVDEKGDEAVAGTQKRNRLAQAFASPQVPVVVLLALLTLMLAYTNSQAPYFLSSFNITNMLVVALPLAAVAMGQMMALLAAEFDISIGGTLTISVIMASTFMSQITPASTAKGLLAMVGVGIGVGLFNAFLTLVLRVNNIVATIATTGILTGLAILLRPQPEGTIGPELGTFVRNSVGVLPIVFIAVVVLAIGLDVWLYRTGQGLAVRAVGLDADSSKRIGIPAVRIKVVGYVVAALGAALGGLLLAGQVGIGSNNVGLNFALPAFAACFLAGATLSGGRGSFTGAVLGAVFLTMLGSATQAVGIEYSAGQVIYGGILLIATAVYAVAARRAAQGGR
jgi:ribose transport system ATP-binding protein